MSDLWHQSQPLGHHWSMARRSAWQHLKDDVWELFREGATPAQVLDHLPSIPKSSVYDWHQQFRNADNRFRNSANQFRNDDSNQTESAIEPSTPPPKLVALDGGDNASDFELARRTLRRIANDRTQPGAVQVQAAMGLMRLTQMRAELPKHILDEIEETTIQDERDRLHNLSPEELTRLYKELLDKYA